MFATWDIASSGRLNDSRRRSSADRACDQCKSKKVSQVRMDFNAIADDLPFFPGPV